MMVRFLVKSRSVRVGCVLREKLAEVKTSQPTGNPSHPKSFLDNSIVKFCHLAVRSQSSQNRSKSSESQFKSFRDNSQSFFAILQNTEKIHLLQKILSMGNIQSKVVTGVPAVAVTVVDTDRFAGTMCR